MAENKGSQKDLKPKVSNFEKQKRTKRIVAGIFSGVVWLVGVCLLFLCLSNLYQQLCNPTGYTGFFGIGEAVVSSSSMEPELYPNDLIFYKETNVENIAVGDTIIYERTDSSGESILIVHEVIQIGDGYVTTKGINNDVPDEAFPTSAIVGKYIFKIGQAGAVLSLLSTAWAPFIIILILLATLVIRIMAYYFHKKKIIKNISSDTNTRTAIDYFFDI